MANALGTLFGDIANAIREKTGETGTMKPAEFPEKISGIETGGGSVGGTLPAGAYMEVLPYAPPNSYYQTLFYLGGELYCMTLNYTGHGEDSTIYKYNGESWDSVCSSGGISPIGAQFVLYNGEWHMFASHEETTHCKFDGTTFTTLSDLPSKLYKSCVFFHDGYVKYYSYYTGTIYVWDDATDTWAAEAVIGSKYDYYYPAVINNEVYFNKNKVLYKYENGAVTQVATLLDIPNAIFAYNDALYYYRNYTSYCKLYRYDVYTGQDVLFGYFTDVTENVPIYDPYMKRLKLLIGKNGDIYAHAVLRIVESTE